MCVCVAVLGMVCDCKKNAVIQLVPTANHDLVILLIVFIVVMVVVTVITLAVFIMTNTLYFKISFHFLYVDYMLTIVIITHYMICVCPSPVLIFSSWSAYSELRPGLIILEIARA